MSELPSSIELSIKSPQKNIAPRQCLWLSNRQSPFYEENAVTFYEDKQKKYKTDSVTARGHHNTGAGKSCHHFYPFDSL